MANNIGTLVAAPVRPFSDADTFPVFYANEGAGGWHSVATTTDMNAIPSSRLIDGMVCWVTADSATYQWNATTSTWNTLNVGSVDLSSPGPIGNVTPSTAAFTNLTVTGTILPTVTSTQDIGSSTARFRSIYVDTAYLSSNTLYLGTTPVLGTEGSVIKITADTNQTIQMTTIGSGQSQIISQNGTLISTSGIGGITQMQSTGTGGQVNLNAALSINLTAPNTYINGNLIIANDTTLNGNVTIAGTSNTLAINTAAISVKDNILLLNSGELGSGVTAGDAGIRIDRGELVDERLIWNETTDTWQMGPIGSEVSIASTALFTSTTSGLVAASGGGSSNFLRADGTWAAPPGGTGSGDLHYTFNQSTASNVWTITHNLGKYPSVTITDSANNTVIGDVTYTSVNELVVTFGSSFGGFAYLN